MPFLEAMLLSGAFAVFMLFAMFDDRIQSLDEVYEWSSSLLLLCLALYYRFVGVQTAPGRCGVSAGTRCIVTTRAPVAQLDKASDF